MKTRRAFRFLGIVAAALLVLFLGYVSVSAFPEPFFPYRVTYKHLTLYSRTPLPAKIESLLQRTDEHLSRSELYNPNLDARIFVCDSDRLFWFFTGQRHIFGVCFPDTSRLIFVPKADYEQDLIPFDRTGPDDNRRRHLSNTLAHEVTHLYITDYLGFGRQEFLPVWVKEGYCEYIGQGDAIDPAVGIRALLSGQTQMKGLYYFQSRRMMELLIDKRQLSIKQILRDPPKEADVHAELLVSLRSHASLSE